MSVLLDLLRVDGFAWGWMLLAVPLPWLVRVLLPARVAEQPALRVPWGDRLQRIAGSGSGVAGVRGFPWLVFAAWCLLCLAAARPQQLGPPTAPPQVGRDMVLAVAANSGNEEDTIIFLNALIQHSRAPVPDFFK